MMMDGVGVAVADMCAYGMPVDTGPVQGPARKMAKIMSNSDEVFKCVAISCPNLGDDQELHHFHVPLESGRARRCQVYPRAFSQQIFEAIAAEKKLRILGMVLMPFMSLESDKADGKAASDVLHDTDGRQASDDQSGDPLVPALVRKARQEEIRYLRFPPMPPIVGHAHI